MPLSKDPDKAAIQLANLAKGRDAAAKKAKSLAVVPYADPPADPPPATEPGSRSDTGNEEGGGNGGLWVMLAAGVTLLLVLVLLARQGRGDE